MSKLYFRYGVMTAGKSTLLLQVAHNYRTNGMNVIIVKPQIDTKGENKVVSRIGISSNVDILLGLTENIYDYEEIAKQSCCILVDESQFLTKEQAISFWKFSKEFNIPVICYGLKTNFKGELFEGSATLMAYADELEELKTICNCGKTARFNARKVNGEFTLSGEEVVIDGNSEVEYIPLCGKCYLKKVIEPI
ncbi:MAG: thymidine kinase [Firmicutes bacterium]|nr:thymidine kinase [Bacillota bacterium]